MRMRTLMNNVTNTSRCRIEGSTTVYMAHHYFKINTTEPKEDFELVDELICTINYEEYKLYYSFEKDMFMLYKGDGGISVTKYNIFNRENNECIISYLLSNFISTRKIDISTDEIKSATYKEVTLDDEYIIIDGIDTPFEQEGENIEEWFNSRQSTKNSMNFVVTNEELIDIRPIRTYQTDYYIRTCNVIVHYNLDSTLRNIFLKLKGYYDNVKQWVISLKQYVSYSDELKDAFLKNGFVNKSPRNSNFNSFYVEENSEKITLLIADLNKNDFDLSFTTSQYILDLPLNKFKQDAIRIIIYETLKTYGLDGDNMVGIKQYLNSLLHKNIFREFCL